VAVRSPSKQAKTHVAVWPPLVFWGVIAALGIYVLLAAEYPKLWLPGRARFQKESFSRFSEESMTEALASAEASASGQSLTLIAEALANIAATLTRLEERLGPTGQPRP